MSNSCFSDFCFDPRVAKGLSTAGYTAPTPIQSLAIPHAMQGRDLVGLAQTGTGKTAAFALPILHRLASGPRGRVRALVLSPTRELAAQINAAFVELGGATGLRCQSVYGGVGFNPQIFGLRRADIVVACPGRLLDLMGRGAAKLNNVEILVLDEADMMLDMGFLPDVKRILAALPASRQTMLFSATMPDAIRDLTRESLNDPETIRAGELRPASTVSHTFCAVAQDDKLAVLESYLKQKTTGSVLVFTRTKHRAKGLAQKLASAGFPADCLQGNMSQNRRQAAMDGFRNGRIKVLVATDIAARGIDVSLVSHVVNFDVPDTVETYTHRTGRTGRAERLGEALTLATYADMGYVRSVERLLGERMVRLDATQGFIPAAPGEGRIAPPAPRGARPAFDRRPKTGGSAGHWTQQGPKSRDGRNARPQGRRAGAPRSEARAH